MPFVHSSETDQVCIKNTHTAEKRVRVPKFLECFPSSDHYVFMTQQHSQAMCNITFVHLWNDKHGALSLSICSAIEKLLLTYLLTSRCLSMHWSLYRANMHGGAMGRAVRRGHHPSNLVGRHNAFAPPPPLPTPHHQYLALEFHILALKIKCQKINRIGIPHNAVRRAQHVLVTVGL